MTPELVLTVIAPLEAALLDWFKAQAAETLKDRLSKDDFQVRACCVSACRGQEGGWEDGWCAHNACVGVAGLRELLLLPRDLSDQGVADQRGVKPRYVLLLLTRLAWK